MCKYTRNIRFLGKMQNLQKKLHFFAINTADLKFGIFFTGENR